MEPMPTDNCEEALNLDEKVFLKNKCTIPRWTHQTMMMGYQLNVMTQALYVEDKANLLNGIYKVRTYLKLQDGSQSIAIIPRTLPVNHWTSPQTRWLPG